MKLTYDFHIHTALSPCADEAMTPNNIVNMALLNSLDAIAITDHNTCENTDKVMKVAKEANLLVIPGMEIETREEIHVVCLFSSLDAVYNVQEIVYEHLPTLQNKKKIFGKQLLFNEEDDVIGEVDRLLAFATSLSIDEVLDIVRRNNGIFVPAHIDRPSYSIISNLGMIPTNMKLPVLEVSRYADYDDYVKRYNSYLMLQSSDAHDLGYIGICGRQIEVKERSISSIIEALSN